MGQQSDVRSVETYPVEADFIASRGSPLVIDRVSGALYALMSDGTIRQINMTDVCFEIQSTGKWRGKDAVIYNILARRSAFVNNTAFQDVVEFSGASLLNYSDPEGANIELHSTSTDDDGSPAGTGAQTVDLTYLDVDGNQQTSTYTLNGTTPVNVGTGVYQVQWMEVSAVGSNVTSVGTITLRNVATPTTIYEQITAGGNKSMSGRYKVPAGHDAYIVAWEAHSLAQKMDFRLRGTVKTHDRSLSTVWHFDDNALLAADTNDDNSMCFAKYPAGSRVKVSVIPGNTAGTIRAEATIQLIVVAQ